MFIAHLPAAYVANHLYQRVQLRHQPSALSFAVLTIGMLGGVVPDIDILYFYTLDQRQHLHRSYLTHQPIFWLLACTSLFVLAWLWRHKSAQQASVLLGLNVMLHLFLDTVSGGIRWLFPWSEHYFNIIHIPARFHPYILNWIFHWSFAIELFICLVALVVYFRHRRRQPRPSTMSKVVWWLPQHE